MKQLQRPYATTLLAVALFTTTACGAKAVARSTYRENSDLLASPTLAQYDQATEEIQAAPTSSTKKKKSTRRKHRSKTKQARGSASACATQSTRHGTSGRGYSYKPITLVAGTPSLIRTVVDHGQKLLGHRYRTRGDQDPPFLGCYSSLCEQDQGPTARRPPLLQGTQSQSEPCRARSYGGQQ